MAGSNMQQRLSNLEDEVAKLKVQISVNQPAVPIKAWWHTIAGTFANDPAHAEAMELGRKYRKSLRPTAHSSAKQTPIKKSR